jgi:hypothetical protein
VAGVAGEVIGAGAVGGDLLADFPGFTHLRVLQRHVDLHVARMPGDIGDQVGDVRRLVALAERLLGDVVELEALLFTMHQTMRRSASITAGVGEIARHLHVGAFDLADALAEVAAFGQRNIFRPALGLPLFLALHFEQLGGIAVLHFGAELLELEGGRILYFGAGCRRLCAGFAGGFLRGLGKRATGDCAWRRSAPMRLCFIVSSCQGMGRVCPAPVIVF